MNNNQVINKEKIQALNNRYKRVVKDYQDTIDTHPHARKETITTLRSNQHVYQLVIRDLEELVK